MWKNEINNFDRFFKPQNDILVPQDFEFIWNELYFCNISGLIDNTRENLSLAACVFLRLLANCTILANCTNSISEKRLPPNYRCALE